MKGLAKKGTLLAGVLIVLGVAAYLYLSRPKDDVLPQDRAQKTKQNIENVEPQRQQMLQQQIQQQIQQEIRRESQRMLENEMRAQAGGGKPEQQGTQQMPMQQMDQQGMKQMPMQPMDQKDNMDSMQKPQEPAPPK